MEVVINDSKIIGKDILANLINALNENCSQQLKYLGISG